MTEADRVQFQFMAEGLSKVTPVRIFSCNITPEQQYFRSGFPNTTFDPGRPAHVTKHFTESKDHQPSAPRPIERIAAIEPFQSLRALRAVTINYFYWRRRRQETARFVRENGIKVVFPMNDTSIYAQAPLAGAKEAGCSVIVARTAVVHYQRTDEGARHSGMHLQRSSMSGTNMDKPRSAIERLMNRYIAWRYPQQVAHTIWGRLLPHQTTDLMALALDGELPRQLWHVGTDWADGIVVSGDDEVRALDRHGVHDVERLAIGSAVFQQISEQLLRRDSIRDDICDALGLDPKKPIALVCSLAAWEHASATYEDQFAHLEKVFALISRFDVQVVVTLHPLSREQDYRFLADRYGLKFLDRQLFSAITFPDLYVTCDASSTLRWGMAVGMPCNSINFNPHGQVRDVHPEFPLQESFETLERWLTEVLPICPISTATLLQKKHLPMGLIRDGKFFEHLADAIRRLTERGNARS